MKKGLACLFMLVFLAATTGWTGEGAAVPPDAGIVTTAPDWSAELIAQVDQSYAGWDVEIGDADNDGKNEVLTTGCPDSRLYLFKKDADAWRTSLLAEDLARHHPGMGLAVRVVDLNRDGRNEIILGTGQEGGGGTAHFYVMETDGTKVTKSTVSRPDCNKSGFTHNLAVHDLDGDGIMEVVSAYCGGGEIIRYDANKSLDTVDARKIHQLSGSGEESLIADVDNDGAVEYVTANGFRAGRARVEVFEFDPAGELASEPRIALEGYEGNPCFYVSIIIGDVDNDGKNEMVAGWKREQSLNLATLIAYKVGAEAVPVCVLERDTPDLDMAYFEKMMAVADADNDGKNELLVSTRGDNMSEFITSAHIGRVYMYRVAGAAVAERTVLADFNTVRAESSWLAVGDADNDGANEVVLATGKGNREQPGKSHVLLLKKDAIR